MRKHTGSEIPTVAPLGLREVVLFTLYVAGGFRQMLDSSMRRCQQVGREVWDDKSVEGWKAHVGKLALGFKLGIDVELKELSRR